mmetsp:Transcript_6298/g.7687  ORF Transcript_6298/g.7687 Transcript_6298/m.7687 type:complete len:291 (+) Transcript_6298:79-951(+)
MGIRFCGNGDREIKIRSLFPLYDHMFKQEVAVNQKLYNFVKKGTYESKYKGIPPERVKRQLGLLWNMAAWKEDKIEQREYKKLVKIFMRGMKIWLVEESTKSLRVVNAAICKSAEMSASVHRNIQKKMRNTEDQIVKAAQDYVTRDLTKSFYNQSWGQLDPLGVGSVSSRAFHTHFLILAANHWDRQKYVELLHEKLEPFLKRNRNVNEISDHNQQQQVVPGSIRDAVEFGRSRWSQMAPSGQRKETSSQDKGGSQNGGSKRGGVAITPRHSVRGSNNHSHKWEGSGKRA